MLEEEAFESAVSACLARVPATCTYNATLTISQTKLGCDDTLGLSLQYLWPALPSATIFQVTGTVALRVTTVTPICNYEVLTSNDWRDECIEPIGTGIANGLTLTNGFGSLDLSGFRAIYINMKTEDPTCGTNFEDAFIDHLQIDVALTGTWSNEVSTESSSGETSGAASLMGLSWTAVVLELIIMA